MVPKPCRHGSFWTRLLPLLALKHHSHKTELAYRSWIKRFIFFHKVRHPSTMAEAEIRQFLAHLAVNLHVSSSTQTVAL